MRSLATVLLTFLGIVGIPLSAQTGLSFRVIDAAYSAALNKIVMVSESPDVLHIYDPVTGTDTTVALPKAPSGVSVGPDGLYAAVAFDSLAGYVNLTTAALVATYPLSGPLTEVILAKDYIHVDLGNNGQRSVQIASGAVTTVANSYYSQLSKARLHPSGRAIYSSASGSWSRVDVSSGPATGTTSPLYSNSGQVCPGTWLSLDGNRAFSGCGTVVTLSATNPQLEMTYRTSLAGLGRIAGVTESAAAQRVAVLPVSDPYNSNTAAVTDSEIYLLDTGTLE